MASPKNVSIYAKCDAIARTKPEFEVDENLVKEIATGFRLLPTFESTLFDKVFAKHYSLKRNDFLKCRWSEYKRNIESRVYAPFQFPDIRDLHFYNCAVRIKPEVSIRFMNHRRKLVPGPGVDSLGHLPIPQEAMMKRGQADDKKKGPRPVSVKKAKKFAKKGGK